MNGDGHESILLPLNHFVNIQNLEHQDLFIAPNNFKQRQASNQRVFSSAQNQNLLLKVAYFY